ncbi:MAG TPA: CpsD/CapB family tyrosine-protein kinase [Blastocatellia bacterium]|nr:CpsD/CapB family tyrosine-protein kinase [Blastocatellia bacterium]
MEDRVTRDLFPENSGQTPAGAENPGAATERYPIAGNGAANGKHHLNLQAQDVDDFRRYLHAARDAEAIAKSGGLARIDGSAMQLRQRIQPAREAALTLTWLDPRLVAFHDFDPQAIAPYNRLAISLISGATSRNLQRVLVTSAQYGEGRTSVTLNLAAALSRARQRVLVVDSDFMRPSTLRLLGVDAETGLAEAIAKGLPVGMAMIRLQPVGFNLLPTRARVENSAELLVSPFFEAVIQILKSDYDFILFDSAPLLAAADASLLELHTDATLMVIRPGYSSTSQMARAIASLNENRLFGAVLNRVVK